MAQPFRRESARSGRSCSRPVGRRGRGAGASAMAVVAVDGGADGHTGGGARRAAPAADPGLDRVRRRYPFDRAGLCLRRTGPGTGRAGPGRYALAQAALHITHHAIVLGVITLIVCACRRQLWIPLLGWWSHGLIDVFTHSVDYYPSPVLWPITRQGLDGIAWNTPWFMGLNYAALLVTCLCLWRAWRPLSHHEIAGPAPASTSPTDGLTSVASTERQHQQHRPSASCSDRKYSASFGGGCSKEVGRDATSRCRHET